MHYKLEADGVSLYVKIKPNSASDKILGLEEIYTVNKGCKFYLLIQICAAKHDGEANERLVDFLAKTLAIPKSNIIIKTGIKARHKTIKLLADPAALAAKVKILGNVN